MFSRSFDDGKGNHLDNAAVPTFNHGSTAENDLMFAIDANASFPAAFMADIKINFFVTAIAVEHPDVPVFDNVTLHEQLIVNKVFN
jgi:hypothetical protein